MRKLTLSFIILFFSALAFSQDYIYLKDNTIIGAVVKEVNLDMIKYVKYTDQNGEVFGISPNLVIKIVFSNGYIREFSGGASSARASGSEGDSYFALAVGSGRSYGGVGIRAQGRFGRKQKFGMHFGLGNNPLDDKDGGVCFGLGVKFFDDKWFYINPQIGIVSHDLYYDYSEYYGGIKIGAQLGLSILFGWDFIFGKHSGLNVAVGVTMAEPDDFRFGYDLGYILKF